MACMSKSLCKLAFENPLETNLWWGSFEVIIEPSFPMRKSHIVAYFHEIFIEAMQMPALSCMALIEMISVLSMLILWIVQKLREKVASATVVPL